MCGREGMEKKGTLRLAHAKASSGDTPPTVAKVSKCRLRNSAGSSKNNEGV